MTGTNNTRRAARLVKHQLESMGHGCSLRDWTHEGFSGWNTADCFGFATPVHSFREPTPFKERIKHIPLNEGQQKPAFIIASCEGEVGNTYYRIAKRLRKKGVNVIGTKTYKAPSNVLMWDKSFERSSKEINEKEDYEILKFAKNLPELADQNSDRNIKRNLLWGFVAALVNDKRMRIMIKGDIKVDTDKCIQCGQCARQCLGQCIELDPYPIIDMDGCVVCLGCINLCPKDALDAKNTRGKPRFKGLGKITVNPL